MKSKKEYILSCIAALLFTVVTSHSNAFQCNNFKTDLSFESRSDGMDVPNNFRAWIKISPDCKTIESSSYDFGLTTWLAADGIERTSNSYPRRQKDPGLFRHTVNFSTCVWNFQNNFSCKYERTGLVRKLPNGADEVEIPRSFSGYVRYTFDDASLNIDVIDWFLNRSFKYTFKYVSQ